MTTMAALLLILLASFSVHSFAFTCPNAFVGSSRYVSVAISPTALSAAGKKRRRRRKDGKRKAPAAPPAEVDSAETSPTSSGFDDNDLPDFDLGDEETVAAAVKDVSPEPAAKKVASPNGSDVSVLSAGGVDLEDPRVLEAMRGSKASSGPKSMDQLLRDRSLEESFKFDPVGEDALPTLGKIASEPNSRGNDIATNESKVGKKRARAEARRAAAIEAEDAEKEEGGILSKIPNFLGEDGKISPLKVSFS
mmetsp:Transcript_43212/g.131578  ORF Transcript_43212/g.131578 Transcript_43212/m.131578 type:complete len:250 (-) Transcript_43212:18-767(-)